MGASLLVTCIAAGLIAVWVVRATLTARSSTTSVPRAEPVTSAFPLIAAPVVVTAPTPIQRPRSGSMARIPAAAARTSTEFPVEHTVYAESVFECVRTDVIAVPPPPPPPRVTLSSIIAVDPAVAQEQSLRAATAAIEALCDEGWESTREIKRPVVTARGSARVIAQSVAPLRVIERVRAPRKRNAKLMGTVIPARSLMSRSFDAAPTVEAAANPLFDDSTAVDELTNNEMPPWLAPTSARFAR